MPPNWPDPPMLEHYLLESPWGPAIVLAAVGVGLFIAGGRRASPLMQWVGGGAGVLLGVGLVLLAMSVQTGREKMVAGTEKLAEAAAEPFDLTTIEKLTTDDATLLGWNRQIMMAVARNASQRVSVDGYSVTAMDVIRDGPNRGRTYVAVIGRVRTELGGGGFRSRWIMRWRKEEDGRWRLAAIERVTVNGSDATDILRRMR